jgi:hypothetical protein
MGTPPSGYSTSIAIPLPTEEQLGAEAVANRLIQPHAPPRRRL